MTDDPNRAQPADAGDREAPESAETSPAADAHTRAASGADAPGQATPDAGAPPLPDAERPRPTPESQAALTGKAPSGSSTSGTTVPAASAESPEEKKARLDRIIAEAKARNAAKAAQSGTPSGADQQTAADQQTPTRKEPPGGASPAIGDPVESPSQADLEKAAKIAEAKARAAALKAAAAKAPAAAGPAAPGAPKAPVKKKDEGPKPADASDHPLARRLRERFGDAITGAFLFLGQLSIHLRRDRVVAVCDALRRDAETPFNYLSDLTCVHYPERAGAPFEIVYNLYSISANVRVRLKVEADESEGVESVTSVWPAANWMEREVYDLFGVPFRHHPDLRRLLLPPDWQGHPFRKEYPLEFMENDWTTRHLPEFSEVQREQLAQRRAYGLEILSTPDERRIRELFRAGREPLSLDRK